MPANADPFLRGAATAVSDSGNIVFFERRWPMAHRAVQARCWRAVRDGDVEYLRLSAPEDWVVANGDSAVELA